VLDDGLHGCGNLVACLDIQAQNLVPTIVFGGALIRSSTQERTTAMSAARHAPAGRESLDREAWQRLGDATIVRLESRGALRREAARRRRDLWMIRWRCMVLYRGR